MTQDSNNAPDYAGHSGAQWTWREYGYEKIVVMDERGTEIAFTHRRDWARLIAAAPELLGAARLLPTDWLKSGVLQSPSTDRIRIELRIEGTTYEAEITVGELRAAAAAIAKAEGRQP